MNDEDFDLTDEFFESRILFFNDDVENKSVFELKKQLIYLDSMSHDDIYLVISSGGGSVYDFLALQGVIKSLKSKLVTIGNGYCFSAAALLLLLGDERYCYDNTRVMFHEIISTMDGSYSDINKDYKETHYLQQQMISLIKRKTNIENVKDWLSRDRYLSKKECYDCGIITSKKVINLEILENIDIELEGD